MLENPLFWSCLLLVISICLICYDKCNSFGLGFALLFLTIVFGFLLSCSIIPLKGTETTIQYIPDEVVKLKHSVVVKFNGVLYENKTQEFYEQDTSNIVFISTFATNAYRRKVSISYGLGIKK